MSEIFCGDCIEVLRTLPDGLVQTCVTSPPYYGLRDYGTAKWEGGDAECDHHHYLGGHGEKSTMQTGSQGTQTYQYKNVCGKCGAIRVDDQIGLEETPEAYVAKLVEVFREVKRVLKDDGTLWLNLGDCYTPQSTHAATHGTRGGMNQMGRDVKDIHKIPAWGKPKDLIGIPWMVAFALRADGWYLRSDIIWSKPNPMPESVTDRCTKAHEYIFLLSKSPRYFYDAGAIAEPAAYDGRKDEEYKGGPKDVSITAHTRWNKDASGNRVRNRRDVWTVTTKPYKEAHFATFPPDLIEPCILAGTSAKGECPECGKAWKRIVNKTTNFEGGSGKAGTLPENIHGKWDGKQYGKNILLGPVVSTETIGWQPQCECGLDPWPQIVLDPFFGSGTTGAVAIAHGREYIGIDLNQKYIDLAIKRINDVPIPLKGLEEKC